jgi:hypothetical protein
VSIDEISPFSSFFTWPFFFISCLVFSLFLRSSGTWLNHFVLGYPISLSPLKYNSDAILVTVVECSLFTWPDHCSHSHISFS